MHPEKPPMETKWTAPKPGRPARREAHSPSQKGAPGSNGGGEGSRPSGGGKINILLVDDRPDKLLALEAVLASLGQNLIKATSGKEALRQLLHQEFAVILLDISMPVMDGFETAAMIRRRPSSEHTPIIFVTSMSDSENHVTKGYSLGAVDYILSPIVPEILRAKVSVFVELYKKTEKIKQQAEQLLKIEEAEHRKQLTAAVDRLEEETKRNRFFTLALDMLAIGNFDGRFLQVNPAWEKVLGYSEDELKTTPAFDFLHPEDLEWAAAESKKLQEGASTSYSEIRVRHKNGSWRWLGFTAAPFVSERLIYIFARDVTVRRQAEQRVQELNGELQQRVAELTDLNNELEAFNYSISHDLRAPLRSMQGFARVLMDDPDNQLSADSKECARRIVRSGQYMDKLLYDLLHYSRLGRAPLEAGPVSLESVVNEVLTHLEQTIQTSKAKVEVRLPRVIAAAHRTTLSMVLTNLIENAMKFTDASKTPVVRIWSEEKPDRVRLFVADNGIGIDQDHHEKIFGLFERLHDSSTYPGTGVGLAIVRKGIERMGGRVGVESKKGEGSQFWLELPLAKLEPE